jgi:multisubunit Na+/H+ antiporter MnhB subunit
MIVRLAVLALAAALVWVVLLPVSPRVDLPAEVRGALAQSGAQQPVTAVLLGFRAYDTLLEVAVLLLAALAAGASAAGASASAAPAGPLLRALVNALVPVMLLVAAYFLWAGAAQPGGAFQAGAVLAAAGVLLRLAGVLPPLDPEHPALRAGLSAGLAAFLAAFLSGTLPGALLAVEALLAASIALALYFLFAAARR